MSEVKRFAAGDVPLELRYPAWNEVLARLGLASETGHAEGPDSGNRVVLAESSGGSVFARLTANRQKIRSRIGVADAPGASPILVLALLEGSVQVLDPSHQGSLKAGSILLLDSTQSWELMLGDGVRAVAMCLVSSSFLRRLIRTGSDGFAQLATDERLGALCFSLIRSMANELPHFDPNELATLESTLSELIVSSLSSGLDEEGKDGTSVQLAHLRRVCRAINVSLKDPELDLEQVAGQERLSVRYLQKLFRSSGTTFSEYVKRRRIDHVCIDLANPKLSRCSITDICFRWGFTDAANFSRAFSQAVGMSPKAYRAAPPRELESRLRRGCPELHGGLPGAGTGPQSNIDHRWRPFLDLLDSHARYALSLHLAPKRIARVSEDSWWTQGRLVGGQQFYLPVSDGSVHWGYFSQNIPPALTVSSGDTVTIETLSQHASDDSERMIRGDHGAESVFHWTAESKNVDRRGAGPMDASIFGRGAGEGFGVHICTGPVYIRDAEPGDVLEVRILDILPRPSQSPDYQGRCFGSNAATWWGFHYSDLITEPKTREVVTIYELHNERPQPHAKAVYNFRWTPQTDPYGVCHGTIDYPGVVVDHSTITKQFGVLNKARIPVRPHFGVLAVAPREAGLVDSIPPSYFGGNLDNWRAGKGASLFLPVAVKGALFSVGDPHASQGDGELCGTAIECSLTGVFQFVLHKQSDLSDDFLGELGYPFLETPDEWIIQGLSFPDYQAELGPNAQTQVYKDANLEAAMRDAFRKTRHFLMKEHQLSEDEAVSLISVAVDFGITQLVDGNLGIHAIIPKAVFSES